MHINTAFRIRANSEEEAISIAEYLIERHNFDTDIFDNTILLPFEKFYDWIFPEDIKLNLPLSSKRLKFEVLPENIVTDRLAQTADQFAEEFCKDQYDEFVDGRDDSLNVSLNELEFNMIGDCNVKVKVNYHVGVGEWDYGTVQTNVSSSEIRTGSGKYEIPNIFETTDPRVDKLNAEGFRYCYGYILREDRDDRVRDVDCVSDNDIYAFLAPEKNVYIVTVDVHV